MLPPTTLQILLLSSLLGASVGPQDAPPSDEAARARVLALELTQSPRLAGTIGSRVGARIVARHLRQAGWSVEFDEREVLLSLPRRLVWRGFEDAGAATPFGEQVDVFDADAVPPGDVPLFNAWSASAHVRAPVVSVGAGLREDYERLAAAGVEVRGAIGLARYGGAYRGVKASLAEEFGCVGLLLFAPAESEGAGRGAVWPGGPWKPGWDAQRGSISPMGKSLGDPSTPHGPSPAPGAKGSARLSRSEWDAALPGIPCLPIGSARAEALLARLAARAPEAGSDPQPIGPGPVEVELDLDVPRELRTIINVIATLPGRDARRVLAGSHRDAWVRGAQDSGSGCVVLLLAAEELGRRARAGWQPEHTLQLCFWDAEESGLIGSTEYGEAQAEVLRREALAYVNADACVSGTHLSVSGSPGMLGIARQVLGQVEPARAEREAGQASLWQTVVERAGEGGPRLGLPGSGSDFAVFLHHLGVPVLELSFGGNGGGQYHTTFDDFDVMDRFLDPGWEGHALAGRAQARLLAGLADAPGAGFDAAEAAETLAEHARELGQADSIGAERAERLGAAFAELARGLRSTRAQRPGPGENAFYRALEVPEGLAGRTWYRNRLWTAGLETGYASETFPTLRSAARESPEALERGLEACIQALRALAVASSATVPADAR